MNIRPISHTPRQKAPIPAQKKGVISPGLKEENIIISSTGLDSDIVSAHRIHDESVIGAPFTPQVEADTEFKSKFIGDFVDAKQVDKKVLELATTYPHLVTLTTRNYKTSGYDGKVRELRGPAPLRYMRICNKRDGEKKNDKKTGVLLIAAPHAREVMQPMIMLETAEQLLKNYNPDSKDPKVKEITEFVDSLDIYIIAVSNPDGLNYAIHDDPNWRKTRRGIKGSNEKGVDCNRNYDYAWIPRDPSSERYSGPHPFSEPETRNIASVVDEHPNVQFVCEFHSAGEEIRRPLRVKDKKDLASFIKIQQRMKNAIGSVRGKEYETIESYVINGSSDDYFYFKKGKFALVIEDGTEYKPPRKEALKIVEENVEGAKEILRIAREYGRETTMASNGGYKGK